MTELKDDTSKQVGVALGDLISIGLSRIFDNLSGEVSDKICVLDLRGVDPKNVEIICMDKNEKSEA